MHTHSHTRKPKHTYTHLDVLSKTEYLPRVPILATQIHTHTRIQTHSHTRKLTHTYTHLDVLSKTEYPPRVPILAT